MGPGEHRPHDEEYWTAPWSTALFAGDLFEAVKLAAYWGRVAVDAKELPLQERGEEELRAVDWPPSRYDGDMFEVSR